MTAHRPADSHSYTRPAGDRAYGCSRRSILTSTIPRACHLKLGPELMSRWLPS